MNTTKKLSHAKILALQKERKRLLAEIATLSALFHGSFLERFSTCSRASCACHQGEQHGPRFYLVITQDKKQRQIYIPQAQIDTVRAGIEQHHRLLEIVDRITAINIELMQGRAFDDTIA